MIKVGATRKARFGKKIGQREGFFQGTNQQRLLSVGQELKVDAQALF